MVVSVQDDWMVAPITLISQALPRLPDILWLWPAPHAETDAGQRRQLQSGKRYNIIRQAARAEMRAVAKLKHFEEELVWATPALPEPCFEGNLRKREQYSTVSPIAVRRLDEMYEWAVAVPGSLLGSGADQIALPIGEGVRIEVVGERVMAVHRFGGYSLGTEVEKRLEQLLLDLRNDGIVTEEVKRDRVWVRVYDSKVGFNSKGLLVMAMYGGSDGVPRVNEIAIDLSGLVSDNFGQQK